MSLVVPGLDLAGPRKAAVLLVSLGPERAAEVLKHLPEHEVETLSVEMASMWRVEPELSEVVFDELAERLDSGAGMALGGIGYAKEVLEHLLGPEKAAAAMATLSESGELRPFDFLRRTPPDQIKAFLQDEAPQTIALVLASIWTSVGGRVLAELPPELQADVAMRIATMRETNPAVLADIDAGLRHKVSSVATQEFASPGGIDSLAEILNSAGRSTERNVIEAIAREDAGLADEVRMRMFTFDDLIQLEDRDMQLVLREVEQKDLVLALRGVGEELVEKILANMSQRGAEMLRDDMEAQPPQRRPVIEEAQSKVVAAVRRLEEAGTLVIRRGSGDGEDPEDDLV